MNQNNDIDELVKLLDSQMTSGTGHINVFQTATNSKNEKTEEKTDEQAFSKKANAANRVCNGSACQVPTLLDISPDEE